MYFLHHWNLKIDKYHPKNVGLPQSEFGDQSRLLSNFYLQSYDFNIKNYCDKIEAKYLRYADDQIIICDKQSINNILYVVCYELNLLGLNLNASKVQQYDKAGIRKFYGIEVFKLLEDKKYDEALNLFFEYKNSPAPFKYISPLKRIISKLGLKPFNLSNQNKIKSLILDYDFLKEGSEYYFNKIFNLLNEDEKNEFIKLLIKISQETVYNAFHYNLLNFCEKHKNKFENEMEQIKVRIEKIAEMQM